MSQEELMNSMYQESQYSVKVRDADSVVRKIHEKEREEKYKVIGEMISIINNKVSNFYIDKDWCALSLDIPMTEEVSYNNEYIKEVEYCLIQMNWNVRIEDCDDSVSGKKFVIKPRNWFINKKDQHGKRGKQKVSLLTLFCVLCGAVATVALITTL